MHRLLVFGVHPYDRTVVAWLVQDKHTVVAAPELAKKHGMSFDTLIGISRTYASSGRVYLPCGHRECL